MIQVGDSVILTNGHPWAGFHGVVVSEPDEWGLYRVALEQGLTVGADDYEIVILTPAGVA
jgi:hypothetical protein